MRGVGGSAGRMPCLRSASLLVQKVYIGQRYTRCPAHNSVSSLALIAIAATRREERICSSTAAVVSQKADQLGLRHLIRADSSLDSLLYVR